jgi:predicted oxidoreductase (fatty acid repression mutant protein)
MNVAWTGHRPEYFANPEAVARAVEAIATVLHAAYGAALVFHCGGQRGVDTWAALAAQRLGLPLQLYLPLPLEQFTADWSPADRAVLERCWDYATERVVVDPTGTLGARAYSARNRLLVERANLLVAVWTGLAASGTGETIQLARAHRRPVEEHRFPASGRVPQPGERGV